MTRKNLISALTVVVWFLLPSVRAQSLAPVIMPGADLMVFMDLGRIQKAPMYTALKEMLEKQNEALAQSLLAGIGQADAFVGAYSTMTGLQPEDLLQLVATVQLKSIDMGRRPDLYTLEAIVGLKLAKEVSIDKLEAGLNSFIAKQTAADGTLPAKLARVAHGDSVLLEITDPGDPRPFYYWAAADGNKVLLMGSKSAVQGALDRYRSGDTVKVATLFPAAVGKVVGRSNFYVIAKPTSKMLAKANGNGDASVNPVGALLSQMKSVGVGLNFAETMDLALVGEFATPEVARQAQTLFDAQAVSGIKMMATMMTGGAPLPVLQTMKTGTGAGGTTWFKLALSKSDLDLAGKVIAAQQQQGGQDDVEVEVQGDGEAW